MPIASSWSRTARTSTTKVSPVRSISTTRARRRRPRSASSSTRPTTTTRTPTTSPASSSDLVTAREGPRPTVGALHMWREGGSGLRQGPQVELDDLGVVHEALAGVGVSVLALVEHIAAIADLQAATGVLLDHDDRDTR